MFSLAPLLAQQHPGAHHTACPLPLMQAGASLCAAAAPPASTTDACCAGCSARRELRETSRRSAAAAPRPWLIFGAGCNLPAVTPSSYSAARCCLCSQRNMQDVHRALLLRCAAGGGRTCKHASCAPGRGRAQSLVRLSAVRLCCCYSFGMHPCNVLQQLVCALSSERPILGVHPAAAATSLLSLLCPASPPVSSSPLSSEHTRPAGSSGGLEAKHLSRPARPGRGGGCLNTAAGAKRGAGAAGGAGARVLLLHIAC